MNVKNTDAREHVGDSSSPSDNLSLKKSPEYLHAEKTALQLVARAEQCTSGMHRKLEKRGFESDIINDVLEQLTSLDLINDRRFSRLWLVSRIRLPRSPRRLLIALCNRGIDRDDAEAALKEVLDPETEYALLLRFAKKYTRKTQVLYCKSFFKNEGFSTIVINRYLEGI